jgi:hypothetical protein
VLQRNRLFACLFRVLERRESDLRLFSARCVLRLLSASRASTVRELQLPKYEAAVCKVLFQLTKASRNDEAFFAADAVAPMLALLAAQSRQLGPRAASSSLPLDALLHLAGALKNLSSTDAGALTLGTLGAVSVLCEVLRACRKAFDGPCQDTQVVVLLTHVAGALRNLSASKAHLKQLAACGAPQLVCGLIGQHLQSDELMYHATRVLAKLSLHETMRHAINGDPTNVAGLFELLDAKGTEWAGGGQGAPPQASTSQATALLVRVAFTLGNLTASNDRNRMLVGAKLGGGVVVLRLLAHAHKRYARQLERDARAEAEEGKEGEGKEDEEAEAGGAELEELLVKLIRLLANLSISSEVGRLLVADEGVRVLPDLLLLSLRRGREELLLNTTSAVTNLSFYGGGDQTNRLFALAPPLCTHLLDVLLHPNEEAVAEAARAFGNFSRNAEVTLTRRTLSRRLRV